MDEGFSKKVKKSHIYKVIELEKSGGMQMDPPPPDYPEDLGVSPNRVKQNE